MKKKLLIVFVLLIQLAAAVVLLRHFGLLPGGDTITIDGTPYPRNSTYLDLSGGPVDELEKLPQFHQLTQLNLRDTGLTAAQYDTLKAAMPDCEIRWSPFFQGSYYPDDTTRLVLKELSDADILTLDYFPRLTSINAALCDDYPQLLALQQRRPDCDIFYHVLLDGEFWDHDETHLTLSGVGTGQLREALTYLPRVEHIFLSGKLPSWEEMTALQADYPAIAFQWQVEFGGVTASQDVREWDISNVPVDDVAQVEALLPYFSNLERVIMCDCGVDNEVMDALNRRYENIRFIWSVNIGPRLRLRTDTTALIPVKWKVWVNDKDCENLKYLTDMVCLDLGHQKITNCDFVAYMPKLKYLLLADTKISDITPIADHEELIYLELFMTNVTDYRPLLTLKKLEDLNLCYTYGPMDTIAKMTWLKHLWWSPDRGVKGDYLVKYLPNTVINTTTPSSTGEGWRELPNYYDMRDMLGMWYMTG